MSGQALSIPHLGRPCPDTKNGPPSKAAAPPLYHLYIGLTGAQHPEPVCHQGTVASDCEQEKVGLT